MASTLPKPLKVFANMLTTQEEELKQKQLSSVSWFGDVVRIKGSAIFRVWRSVIWSCGFPFLGSISKIAVVTAWSVVVSLVQDVDGRDWRLTNQVTPLLSVIVSLLLVKRTGSAYARWDAGRQTFSSMHAAIRNLCRFAWINIGAAQFDPAREHPYQNPSWTPADQEAKLTMMRLCVGFMTACKHHVRGEYGTHYEDLKGLIPAHVAQKNATLQASYGTLPDCVAELPYQHHVGSQSEEDHVLIPNYFRKPAIPLPVVLIHYLQAYFAKENAKGHLQLCGPSGNNMLHNQLCALTSEFNNLERLSTLPLPLIYGIHLKQVITLYLVILPLTLVDLMSYAMIPFTTAFAFTLLGIEGISQEIDYPFGSKSLSDLPLDLFCADLAFEIEHMCRHFPDQLDDVF